MKIEFEQSVLDRQGDEEIQKQTIGCLMERLNDKSIFDALCTATLETLNTDLRQLLIKTLQPHSKRACRWFASAANSSRDRGRQRRALIILSYLNCRTDEAKAAVEVGLHDSEFETRAAAALSCGLFDDLKFASEVDVFLEKQTFFKNK